MAKRTKRSSESAAIRPYVTGAVQPKLNQRNMKAVPFAVAPRAIGAASTQATFLFDTHAARTEAAQRVGEEVSR